MKNTMLMIFKRKFSGIEWIFVYLSKFTKLLYLQRKELLKVVENVKEVV
jgi:hypothetical protein